MTRRAWEEMSPDLITIGWNEPIERAYARMRAKRVRHLPVLDDRGDVAGILSDRDVQRAMISQVDAPTRQPFPDETIEFDPESRVRDYMSWPAEFADQSTDLRAVAERMVSEKISSLLVSRGDTILGIVTAEDLLKVLIQVLAEPTAPQNWTLKRLLDETGIHLAKTLV